MVNYFIKKKEGAEMKSLLILILIIFIPFAAHADVRLPDILGSSMVLQQKQAVPIWGTAEPGETVTVTFGGQKKTVVAGGDGKWRVSLDKLAGSFKPQVMTISGKNRIELTDILNGEGWIVS